MPYSPHKLIRQRVNLYKMARKFIRDHDWQRQPHVKNGPPVSLWWHRRPAPDRHLVIDAYIDRCKLGRKHKDGPLPEDFKDDLIQWLAELSRLQNKKAWGQPRTLRYWSIPSYALAHEMEPAALMKRLRELEKIARQKFPDSVPSSRKVRAPLTEKEIQRIRQQYLAGVDAKKLADEFRITPSHVGRLCREEKAIRAAEREKARNKPGERIDPASEPFDDGEHIP